MVDMAQADRTLYFTPKTEHQGISWIHAVRLAVEHLGYESIMDVPDEKVNLMHEEARRIREESRIHKKI